MDTESTKPLPRPVYLSAAHPAVRDGDKATLPQLAKVGALSPVSACPNTASRGVVGSGGGSKGHLLGRDAHESVQGDLQRPEHHSPSRVNHISGDGTVT